MNKLSKILGFFLLISVVLIVSGFITGGSIKGMTSVFNHDYKYTKQDNIEFLDNIDTIVVDGSSRDIEFIISDTNYIEYYLNDKTDIVNTLTNENELYFSFDYKINLLGSISYGYTSKEVSTIKIHVKQNLLNRINVYVGSGSLSIKGIYSLNLLEINVKSGLINIEDSIIENTGIKVSSGTVKVIDSTINKLNIDNRSGLTTLKNNNIIDTLTITGSSSTIKIDDVTTNVIDVNIKSGTIKMKNVIGNNGNFKLSSGILRITNNMINDNNIEISSGSATIIDSRNQEDMAFKGKISSGIIKIFGKNSNNIDQEFTNKLITYTLKSSSGTIRINNK